MILVVIALIAVIASLAYALCHADKCPCGGTIRWTGYGDKYSCERCGTIIK